MKATPHGGSAILTSGEGTPEDVLAGRAQWALVLGDGDAYLESLADGAVDHVITDPEYNERTHKGAICGTALPDGDIRSKQDGKTGETGVSFAHLQDTKAPWLAAQFVRVSKRWALAFCAFEQLALYESGAPKCWVRSGIWDKISPSPQLTGDRPGQGGEGIAILHREGRKRWNGGGKAAIWRCLAPKGADRPDHPTPKPVKLLIDLVNDFTDPGEVVLDVRAGSCSTGCACIRTGRRFIGFEIDPVAYAEGLALMQGEMGMLSVKDLRRGQMSLLAEPVRSGWKV